MNTWNWNRTTLARALAPLVASAAIAALAAAAGCYPSDVGLALDDSHDHGSCCSTPPPSAGPLQVDLSGIDALDGFVEPSGLVHLSEGLQTTDAGTVAFESFDLTALPPGARIGWAQMVLTNAWWTTSGSSIELDVSTVPYGNQLDSGDPAIAGFATEAFTLGLGAQGAAVTLDVSDLVTDEVMHGASLFQVRLDSFGGDLGFDDAGGHLGLGLALAPVLTVSYD